MPTILKRADLARAYRNGHAGLLRYHEYPILVGPLTIGPVDGDHDSFATVRDIDGLPALSMVHRWDGDLIDQHAELLNDERVLVTRAHLLAAHVYSQTFTASLDRRHERDIRSDFYDNKLWYYGESADAMQRILDQLLARHDDLMAS